MTTVLVLNAGSSSLKFAVYAPGDEQPEAQGQVARIGGGEPATISLKNAAGDSVSLPEPGILADHSEALGAALSALAQHIPQRSIDAVGHRIVHGGTDFQAPALLDETAIARLEALQPLAPLHQPHSLAGIRAARAAFPEAQQIGCFDTAFHRTTPRLNDMFALPGAFYDQGIRRYGFHGLSYDYIAGALREAAPDLAAGRVVVAHLGNGSSLCAMRDGKSVASTMGFSVLDGLPMGTRCGQIDPGVLLYLLDHGMERAELSDLLYRRSGLLGISGISNDMQLLEDSDAPKAAEAIAYYISRLVRGIAEMTATLGGIDALVFTAGIGENAAGLRAKACAGLGFLGVQIDAQANVSGVEVISPPDAQVSVRVMPTHEDLVILRAVRRLVA